MTSQSSKLEKFQRALCDRLDKTNEKLDRIVALLVSAQLLEECVSPEGEIRDAQQCAEIVVESFSAGLCLTEELTSRTKDIEYQKSEFFVDDDEDEDEEEEDDDSDEDDGPDEPRLFSMAF
jgi:hypothetical protein